MIIAGDLNDRHEGKTCGIAAARRKGDDLGTAADHARDDFSVLAFVFHEEQALLPVFRRRSI